MRQVLHLLVLDADRGACLAAPFASRWLLPVLTCGERVRADRTALRWMTDRGLDGDVVGQWLGWMTSQATDWLMVLRVNRPTAVLDAQLAWTAPETLTPATALLDYQGWAVARSGWCGGPPSVPGPFGRIGWLDEVRPWIEKAAGSACGCFMPYRTGAHEVVLGACCESGPVYFKGLTADRAGEARLTELLGALEPAYFARTLAIEKRKAGTVWWLAAGCRGRPAVDAEPVAPALARVQQRLLRSAAAMRELPALDWEAAVEWAIGLAGDPRAAAIESHIGAVLNAGVPHGWIPMDLDPVNVLIDAGGEVRFIDLDDSFLGPVPLAMALFAKRSRSTSGYGAYADAWPPPLRDVDWPRFETAAAVVEAWLGWRRVERHVRRGHLHGDLAVVERRIRERLSRALQRL